MKIRTKQILAREFLFLIGTSILFVILVFSGKYLSEKNSDEKSKIDKEILNLTLIENLPYNLRVLEALNGEAAMKNRTDIYQEPIKAEKFIEKLKTDKKTASKIFIFFKTNFSDFEKTEKEFLTRIKEDNESKNHLKELAKLKELKNANLNSIFRNKFDNKESKIEFGLWLFFLFFIIRYIFYGTKWSLKQFRINNQ